MATCHTYSNEYRNTDLGTFRRSQADYLHRVHIHIIVFKQIIWTGYSKAVDLCKHFWYVADQISFVLHM